MKVLVFNTGSSSHKCSLFVDNHFIWNAHMQWKENFTDANLLVDGQHFPVSITSAKEGLKEILKHLPERELDAIGHRVVHGGEILTETVRIDDKVKDQIASVAYLAPLHNSINLDGIEIAEGAFPGVPQFAVFDTAFHKTLSEVASTYPLPYKWKEKGIRKYGFHGISYSYVTKKIQKHVESPGKMVICHLGAGASLCAVDQGKSVDTTMGMTPLEGLMMASRSGSIDPGILFHLLESEEVSPKELDTILNKQSGILGVSGISEDLRLVLKAAQKENERAQLAVEMFLHHLVGGIGQMVASLGGLDTLVFTAGIGEHAPLIREKACQALAFLNVQLDPEKNTPTSHEEREISALSSQVRVFVIPTHEEWEIADACQQKLHEKARSA